MHQIDRRSWLPVIKVSEAYRSGNKVGLAVLLAYSLVPQQEDENLVYEATLP
jgi:hypothetical protein